MEKYLERLLLKIVFLLLVAAMQRQTIQNTFRLTTLYTYFYKTKIKKDKEAEVIDICRKTTTMSLSRDGQEKQVAKWMTTGDDTKQQNPLRRAQMVTSDMQAKSPLQKFQMPKDYFWNTHPRATTALTVVAFFTIFIG